MRAGLDLDQSFDTLPDETTLEETKHNIEERNISASIFEDDEKPLQHLKDQIPARSTVMNGRSTMMHDIGLIEHLQQEPSFSYLKNQIRQTDDDEDRRDA